MASAPRRGVSAGSRRPGGRLQREAEAADALQPRRQVREAHYPVDTGLRRAVITPTGEDRGKQLECATFMLLRQRFRDVCYWRDRGEVDFVVLKGRNPVPVQVAWDGPAERHQRALDAFYEAHPHAGEAVFVTADSFAEGVPELRPES